MMDQSANGHPQTFPPPMAHYIPPSVPPIATSYQQQQQQQQHHPQSLGQPPLIQYSPTAASLSDAEVSATNFSAQQQQQQMAAIMQMQQQQWAAAAGGFASPYMMPYPTGPMMMMPSQAGMDRPASRQSSRPPSRHSIAAPISSSRSMTNGQTGVPAQASASAQAMLPNHGYPTFAPPGMYNPWFEPYWQSMYASYQHPYSYGYTDEMMKYWRQPPQTDDDRYSHHSAAYSHSKQSQHSSSMQTWGSIDSLNDPYYQNHNATANGYYPPKQISTTNQAKRPTKPTNDPNTLLTIAPALNQRPTSGESKRKDANAPGNAADEDGVDDDDDDDNDDDDDDDEEEEESDEDSDGGSSDRFSIKSDLAQINEESSKARQTPLLYVKPHLRARFVFNQLIQVLPQSPSDTSQPATVEIISADSLHLMAPSLNEERQLMADFIGPLTASTAKTNVIRYCERQSQLAHKSLRVIDRDALSLLWQYMALLVKTNGVIDVRVDIPKILWSSCNTPIVDELSANSNLPPTSSAITLENSLREFLALGEIDNSIKFACENQLHTHALIISYLTDKHLFERTMQNIIANLANGDVLKTFYELGAGSTPSVVSNVTKAHYGDWKRHLAVILANRSDTNAQFVDLCVKTMGDTLVTSGRIYAGHFCYLIANVPFGSYRSNADKLAVLGSLHAGQANLAFISIPNLQLTEVYEYALRNCLTTFIPLKIYYTSKLVLHGLKREALAYCEEIGQTLMRQGNVSYIQLVDLQLFILIAEKSRAFSRNFQLDPTSYKEPTWLIELRHTIQNLIDNAFLNKTVRDESLNGLTQQPLPLVKSERNKLQQPTIPSNHIDKQSDNISRQPELPVAPVPSSSTSYLPKTSTITQNGYDLPNQFSTEQLPHHNPVTTNYQNNLTVDTTTHYPPSAQSSNYYQPSSQQQQYYPTDVQPTDTNSYTQQWTQQPTNPTQLDQLNPLSQTPSINNSYYQPPGDQTQYIQPDFTSTPNPYSSYQPPPPQQWHPSGQVEERERLPSNESQTSAITEEQPQQTKKKHAIFDDSDDVFPTNQQKSSDTKTNATTAANQAAAGGQRTGLVGKILSGIGWKRPTQAHLPDDKNKTLKFDPKTGRWIDTAKSADEQASAIVKPPPMIASNNQSSSLVSNPTQPPPFNPSMPPGPSQASQPRTLSFAAGATTNTTAPQTNAPVWPSQPNASSISTIAQPQIPQQQSQPQQQPPKPPAQLSAAQQRLQAIRQQQAAAVQQAPVPAATSSNQYSLRNRATQSRYVDVLASTRGTVATNPNISLNDLIPTPSAALQSDSRTYNPI